MKWILRWIKAKIEAWKRDKKFRKKLKELRERDPFIYNH